MGRGMICARKNKRKSLETNAASKELMWLQQTEEQGEYVQHRDKIQQSGFILAAAFYFSFYSLEFFLPHWYFL